MSKKYCVANYKGEIIAHDITSKTKAKLICADQAEKEPNAEWEVVEQ